MHITSWKPLSRLCLENNASLSTVDVKNRRVDALILVTSETRVGAALAIIHHLKKKAWRSFLQNVLRCFFSPGSGRDETEWCCCGESRRPRDEWVKMDGRSAEWLFTPVSGNPPYASADDVTQELLGSMTQRRRRWRWSRVGLQVLKRGGGENTVSRVIEMRLNTLKNEQNTAVSPLTHCECLFYCSFLQVLIKKA